MSKYTEFAQDVLAQNDTGEWTIPAGHVYPHQWLWDSAFTAIGLAVYDPHRAAQELISLKRGQWSNGMLPHMIFSPQPGRPDDSWLWRSRRVTNLAPRNVWTSGITQPPVLADAVQRVAKALEQNERKSFLEIMVPVLLDYHQWLYRERDATQCGLVTLYHPWETGLDNTPSWQFTNSYIHTPRWLRVAHKLNLHKLLDRNRPDTESSNESERASSYNSLKLVHAARSLKKHGYNWSRVAQDPHFAIQSLSFNAILIRNNQILLELCKELNAAVPPVLAQAIDRATTALEGLWSEDFGEYFHRDVTTGNLVPISTISTLIALYSGVIPEKRVAKLVSKLHDPHQFQANYIIPTVPVGSPAFDPINYWQGPVWMNTNWLIFDGLRRLGLEREALLIRDASIHLFEESGSFEYFSPLDGSGRGIQDFSWTAALYLAFIADA